MDKQGIVVSIVAWLAWMIWYLNARERREFSSPKAPDQLWSPFCLMYGGYQGSFPGVKEPGPEVNHTVSFK